MTNNGLSAIAEARQPIAIVEYTRDQIELIKRTIAKGLSDDELELFVYQAKRTGLDPFSKQIHAVKRWDDTQQMKVMTIQTGIDGYRLIADRTGLYVPGRDSTYTYDQNGRLKTATAYVKKFSHGEWHEIAATAFWDEYVQKKKDGGVTKFWREKGHVMLSKCAESLALRRAFPQELSGIYTSEEMSQATEEDDEEHQQQEKPKALPNKPAQVTAEQAAELRLLFSKHDADVTKLLNTWNLSSLEQLLAADFQKVKDALLKKPLRQPGPNSGDVAKSSPQTAQTPSDNGEPEDISQNQEEEIAF